MKWPDGSWKAPPPLHACISAKGAFAQRFHLCFYGISNQALTASIFAGGCKMNLEDFIAMKPSNDKGATAHGLVLNEDAFKLWLAPEGQSHEPVAIPMRVAMQP